MYKSQQKEGIEIPMLKRISVLGLICSFFLLAASMAMGALNPKFGLSQGSEVAFGYSDADMNKCLDGMAATGAQYLRVDFYWDYIQAGGASSWNWTALDRIVNAASARGMKILALPNGVPAWAGNPPNNYNAVYTFMYQLGLRYIPKGVTEWEMWNELNLAPGITGDVYANKFLKPAADGIRAAANSLGKQVTVVSCGMAASVTQATLASVFLTAIYNAGGKNYFDAVGFHPYNANLPPTDPGCGFAKLPGLYNIMVNYGDSAKKIWCTEFGYTNTTKGGGVSETTASSYFTQCYNLWKGYSYCSGPFIYYEYRDHSTVDDYEGRFGLVRYDWSAKPMLQTFKDTVVQNPPGSPVSPTTYYRIRNRWLGTYLFANSGQVKYGSPLPSDQTSHWLIENSATATGQKRIKNRSGAGYMHIANLYSYLQCGNLGDDQWSTHWLLEDYDGCKRLSNAWKGTYVNVEQQYGYAECSAIAIGAWSSHWILEAAPSAGLLNGGFESNGAATQSPTGWQTWSADGTNDQDYTSGGTVHSGSWMLTHWKGVNYQVTTYQTVTGLVNGSYKVSAWVKRSSSFTTSRMEISNYGAGAVYVSIPATTTWTQIYTTVNVTNSQIQIGFYSNAAANNWLNLDDVVLTKL